MAKPYKELIEDFKSGKYFFPSDDIEADKKGATWCRQYQEAIYSMFMRDRAAITSSDRVLMGINRLYGKGMQPVDKYKPAVLGVKPNAGPQSAATSADFLRKGLVNINWEILSVIPKFKAVVLGLFEGIDHTIEADSIDENAGAEKEEQVYASWFEATHGERFRKMLADIGIESAPQQYLPDSLEEAQVYNELGGFKLKEEIALEECVEATFTLISDWITLKRKLLEDALDIAISACRDEFDPEISMMVTKYVDPMGLIAQHTRETDFNNSKYFGHFEDYTISQLRVLTGMNEEALQSLAVSYCGYNGNPNLDTWNSFNLFDNSTNSWGYDSFKMNVFCSEWQSVNKDYKTYRKKNGVDIVQKEKYGKEWNTENRKTQITDVRLWYASKWIVGSTVVFEYGPLNDQARPTIKASRSSYHVYKFPGKSLVETLEPNADMIQLAFLKMQNGLAQAGPAGEAIEISALSNITIAGKNLSPLEILTIKLQTGRLLYKGTTHKGVVNMPGGIPIQPMDVGVGKILADSVQIIEAQLMLMRQAIGIDEYSTASAQPGQGTATEAKIAVSATNNVLKPMYAGILYLKTSLATSLGNRIPIIVDNDPAAYKAYSGIIGEVKVKALKLAASKGLIYYGIKMVPKASENDRQRIAQSAESALLSGKNGIPQLTWPEYMRVMRMLETGNTKFADSLLGYLIRKREAEEKKHAELMLMKQGESIMAQDNNKLKNEKDMLEFKADQEIRVLAYKAMFEEDKTHSVEERKFIQEMAQKAIDHAHENSQAPQQTAQ